MDNPDNKGQHHTDHYHSTLEQWINDQKAANSFIDVLGKLWYDKDIELIFLRRQLLDRGANSILHKHSYAENIIMKKLTIQDSLLIAQGMLELDIAPARIDIGRLNREWVEEKDHVGHDVKAFLKNKLAHIISVAPRSTKTKDVILYGFGRVGRLLARELIHGAGKGSQLRLRAIVTRGNSDEEIRKRASLLRKDSVHGVFTGIALENVDDSTLFINGQTVHMISASNPEEVNYETYGIKNALLIDNTGIVRDRASLSRHLKAQGVDMVLLTAPGKGDIPNIVYGVNQETCIIGPDGEKIFSAASCTTNAVVPVLDVIHRELGIVKGHIETVHSYTNDQNLLDNYHKKSRRGRSAPLNMVITETGAASAAVKAIPSLKGKLTANAVRVPTPNVSLAILMLEIERETSMEEVNEIMRNASLKGRLIEQIRYSTSNELVSSDCIGDSCACIYDSPATLVSGDKKNIVLYAWYDNEYGYACQVVRLAKHISEVKSYRYY
ncbi:MAG: glyceraldehyde-3-phosphate dehydrogenase [Bacteroidales bacterium]|nr:glyceraldehyde-3-phosphate dehydrogenase [Bacteroidales bacterium]MDZ4205135.1 glyceraldehyde-3-phosphate dehydrogenase [Bacteroidales bacterium]